MGGKLRMTAKYSYQSFKEDNLYACIEESLLVVEIE